MIAASAFVAVAVVVQFPFNILPARVNRQRFPKEGNITSIETADGPVSSSPRAHHMIADGSHPDVADTLSGGHKFGNRPSMIPHMSLKGLPPQEEGEIYSTESRNGSDWLTYQSEVKSYNGVTCHHNRPICKARF